MSVPADRHYLETHEWHKRDGDMVTIGITQHAADELTDITFVQLPKVGATVSAGKAFGEIESVKATAELVSGIDGTVVAINESLSTQPGQVNQDPFSAGWMIKVQAANPAAVESLLSAETYEKTAGH